MNIQNITYGKLTAENFDVNSLDDFIRHQQVKKCWRKINNVFMLVKNEYVEDWSLDRHREVACEILNGIKEGGVGFGAFCDGRVVGYTYLSKQLFGSKLQYMELKLFHVSEPFRGNGIGKELFKRTCTEAKQSGAKKLYISAHSSEESQAVYRSLGCMDAVEVNKDIAENEPYDVQMEYQLDLHPKGVGI